MSSHVYAAKVLNMAVAQICLTFGWQAAKPSALERLVSVAQHYVRELTLHMVRHSELNNRSEANLDDLAWAFRAVGVDLAEVLAYAEAVESLPLPFGVARFPLTPTRTTLAKPERHLKELIDPPQAGTAPQSPSTWKIVSAQPAASSAHGGAGDEPKVPRIVVKLCPNDWDVTKV